jgi:hypothetical protein
MLMSPGMLGSIQSDMLEPLCLSAGGCADARALVQWFGGQRWRREGISTTAAGSELELAIATPKSKPPVKKKKPLKVRACRLTPTLWDTTARRTEPSRAEPSRAEPSRAEPSRASCVQVHLFPTFATRDADGCGWVTNIHGWIFDPAPDSNTDPASRWFAHRISRNLACRALGLQELGASQLA